MTLKNKIERAIKRELKEHDLLDLLNIIEAIMLDFDCELGIHQVIYQMKKLEGFK